MKENLFLEGINLLLEETAIITLKKNILGNPVFVGNINSKKNKKETPIEKLPKSILDKMIKKLEQSNPQVKDLESLNKFIKEQPNNIKFSMVGKTFRLIDDGSEKQKRNMSDIVVRAKYGKA